ncbi:MAG: hypothetical protein NZM06_02060 [Chloroherpetonaceae bacterium]|nr:hypothetical protein [Chloroherpetonaceae bacterium]MDW8438444.1 hypothetical protein [Chloroherpetonaceae bacterium]
MKRLAIFLLGAMFFAGCATSGGLGKPSQLRCSCGLPLGHSGAHAYNINDFIKAKQAQRPPLEQSALGN